MNLLERLFDERFLEHRRRSTSYAGLASGLFAMKSVSLVWMMRLGIPVPAAGLSSDVPPPVASGRP